MARLVKVKEVKERIKANKIIMKESKKMIVTAMTDASKGQSIDAKEARTTLAAFLKAATRIETDNAKLVSAGE